MKKRIISFSIIAAMLLSPITAFADNAADSTRTPGSTEAGYTTVGDSEDFKSFTAGGATYYDIYNGKTTNREEVDDLDALVKQTLYSVPDDSSYSVAEYWASLATGIFASNPKSYWSYGSEPFKNRFLKAPKPGTGNYGDLHEAFSNPKAQKFTSNKKGEFSRFNDINTIYSGLQKATCLNDVQVNACSTLAKLNNAKAEGSHFRMYNELEAMSRDNERKDPVYYQLMATRDRVGKTFEYRYTCFGIVYSDFTIIPFCGDNGEGFTTALKDYEMINQAIADTQTGTAVPGFKSSAEEKTTKSIVRNNTKLSTKSGMTTSSALSTTFTSEVNNSSSLSFGHKESLSLGYKFDLQAAGELKFEGGISFSHNQLFEKGFSKSNSTTETINHTKIESTEVAPHSAVEQMSTVATFKDTILYDCPVRIAYNVTIFSMSGQYYDDAVATCYFGTSGYKQQSFMTQFGNKKGAADDNLKLRVEQGTAADSANGLTRGISVKHGPWTDYPWERPWTNHLVYEDIESQMTSLGLSPSYSQSVDFITNHRPMSLTGGTFERTGEKTTFWIGERFPIYPLKRVVLAETCSDKVSIAPREKSYLPGPEMIAYDSEGAVFCNFDSTHTKKGYWALVDDDGNIIKKSKVVKLVGNKNGNYYVVGLSAGTAKVKYFVKEEAYKLLDGSYTDPDKVKTPTIQFTVTEEAYDEMNSSGEDTSTVVITDEEKGKYFHYLSCDPEYCSVAEAALFLKNYVGANMTLIEMIYADALLQLAKDEIANNELHEDQEIDAITWAIQGGHFKELEKNLAAHRGITELEFAQVAYNVSKKFDKDVEAPDVIDEYAGSEKLNDEQKIALNWAISMGILSDEEESSKTLNYDRLLTTNDVSNFFDPAR